MAPMTNWLTFSLSPMDMLRSSDQSQFVSYDASPAASSSPYLLDNFYGWTNQKPQEFFKDEAQIAASMADSTILTTFVDPQTHSHNHIPKLEDFLGDVRYSDNSQTETQDSSSLTHIYDPRHHNHNQNGFYSDHNHEFKTMAGFQTAFSTNSGSEVEDSASIGRTHLAGEYLGHVVESSGPELGFHGGANTGGALSLGVNVNNNTNRRTSNDYNQISEHHYRGNNNGERTTNNNNKGEEKTVSEKEKPVVAVETSDCSNKKIADTFGQRTSIYRGVTRHRWTGRYEAHLWDNSCRREGQARKGRQVYLGGYDKEDKAARAYDLAALKYWNATATTNFPITNYSKELEEMKHMTKQEFIASLRRKSSGFSRGASMYRGVTRHHQQGRWQARIGRVAGNKDLYLGTFATEEEAAEAYDIAAIKFRGINAVTNFEMNRYDVEAIMKSQVKEMIPDEHCCYHDDDKPAEIFQEASVLETMPPLMVEAIQGDEDDVLLTPPPAAVSNGNVNPRRHSTGALDKRGGKAQAQTRYRGNQTSSTHDLCKHGKRREEDLVVKPWKLVKKKDVESGGDLVKRESLSVVRKSLGNVSKPEKSLQVAKRDGDATSEVVKSRDAKRSETKSCITPSDSPSGGVRMVKKTNLDVKKVPRIRESKSSKEDLVKSPKKKVNDEPVRYDDVVEKKATGISENKTSKEDLVKSLKKKEEIDEPVRCDEVSEKTLYVVESSIEEKKKLKKKIITGVKSEIQQSSVKKSLRQRTPTLIPSLSPSTEEVKQSRVTKSDPRPIRQTTTRPKTGLSEKKQSGSATLVTNSKTESKIKPKRIGLKVTPPPPSGPPTRPVSFRKGKFLEPKPEDKTLTSIKFKKRVVQEPKLRSDGSKKKKNLKDVGKVSYTSVEGKREKVVLRHRKVEAKKKLQTLFNNVIEETVSKLEEVRKSKVKALVGAFETVISLQDNDVTSQKKNKVQSKSTSSQVAEG